MDYCWTFVLNRRTYIALVYFSVIEGNLWICWIAPEFIHQLIECVLMFCLYYLQVYSPNPEEFNQDSARYPSPKPGGPPSLYSEYSYPGRIFPSVQGRLQEFLQEEARKKYMCIHLVCMYVYIYIYIYVCIYIPLICIYKM